MRVATDDEMYRVDRTYLGPKGRRLPWKATYRAYGVWLVLTLVLGLVALKAGVGFSLANILLLLTTSVVTTTYLMKAVDSDRPLSSFLVTAWHEISAPRPLTGADRPRVHAVEVRAPRWRAGATPHRRWWARSRRTAHEENR